MKEFDYSVPAELFMRGIGAGGKRLVYRRFASAATAIQYAVEHAEGFRAVTLEIQEERFEKAAIRELYDALSYPLARSANLAA